MLITKISQRGNSLGVNIPTSYLRDLGWRKGDHVMLEIQNGFLLADKVVPEKRPVKLRTPAHRDLSHAAIEG